MLFPFSPSARVVVNQGHAPRSLDFFKDHRDAAISSIHQFVAGIGPPGACVRVRQCESAVMQVRACEHGSDGHATAGGIEVQFVALPTDFVALRVFLCARSTCRTNLCEHLRQRLAALALQRAGPWGGANSAFLRATTFF